MAGQSLRSADCPERHQDLYPRLQLGEETPEYGGAAIHFKLDFELHSERELRKKGLSNLRTRVSNQPSRGN